jgi:hypothetical protein
MAGGGFTFGALVASFLVFDLSSRAIPVLHEYCTKRVSTISCLLPLIVSVC